jgi:hypothetical protein
MPPCPLMRGEWYSYCNKILPENSGALHAASCGEGLYEDSWRPKSREAPKDNIRPLTRPHTHTLFCARCPFDHLPHVRMNIYIVQLRIPRLPLCLVETPVCHDAFICLAQMLLAIHRRLWSQLHRPSFTVLSFVTLLVMSYLIPTHHVCVCSFPFGNHTSMIATRF